MKSPFVVHAWSRLCRPVVLLCCLLALVAGGCSHLSKPTLGISGTDGSELRH